MAISGIKTVFLPIGAQADGAVSSSCAYGISLAAAAGAHLTARCYGVLFEPPMAIAPGFVAGLATGANEEEMKRIEALKESVSAAAGRAGISFDTGTRQDSVRGLMDETATLGRLSDIIVLDNAAGYLAIGHALLEEALFQTGRPIIVTPQGRAAFSAGRIMIGWDESGRASRAVHDALPFLREAAKVEIVCVTNEKELKRSIPGTEIAQHLRRHGVKAEVTDLVPPDRNAANALRAHAISSGAEMLVMGAYARSFFRQMIWGGVTETMLSDPPTAVFMSH